MIDGTNLLNLSEAAAIVVLGVSSTWYARRAQAAGEKAVTQTVATSNGFAGQVKGDLTAIRAHLAAQDMHLVAQDEQVADIRKVLGKHATILDRYIDDGK